MSHVTVEIKDVRSASAAPVSGSACVPVRFKRLHAGAIVPKYQTDLAAGMDLHACLTLDEESASRGGVVVEPIARGGGTVLIPTGWALAIPEGFEGQVRPRSGLAVKFGVTVANAPGTIDADYRGELKVALVNLGREAFVVEQGARIAQLVIAPVVRAGIEEVATLDDTARGTGGFGSTGRH